MKKMVALLLIFGVILGGVGCSEPQVQEPTQTPQLQTRDVVVEGPTVPLEGPVTDLPLYGVVMEPVNEVLRAEDGTELYKCSYPKLRVILDGCDAEETVAADIASRTAAFYQDAEAIRHSAQTDQGSAQVRMAYYAQMDSTLARLDGAVMSLFEQYEFYSGGTHPSQTTGSVTYDLSDGRVLTLGDILVEGWSWEALADKVCQALQDKASTLYPDYEAVIRDRFSRNMDGSREWFLSGEGLCFHFSPYDIAAPYAGVVTAVVAYKELEGLLREDYFPQTATANGSVYVELCDREPTCDCLVQLGLDPQGERILFYPDAAVTQLRIEVGQQTAEGFAPEALVFAAGTMGPGDGVCLQTDLEGGTLRLTYCSGGQEVSAVVQYDSEAQRVMLR